jgi:hypothetical protein
MESKAERVLSIGILLLSIVIWIVAIWLLIRECTAE